MEKAYYTTKESVEEYIRMAKDVNGALLIEKLKPYLTPGSTLLELGSGPGTDWKILNECYKVTGSDFSREFLKHLRKTYPMGEFLELDAQSIKTKQKFDGIYSNKVFQHLHDDEIKNSVQRQADILLPGGVICHSFWKGEGEEMYNGLLVNYQTESSLQSLFKETFEILLIETYKEFDEDDSLLFIARKK